MMEEVIPESLSLFSRPPTLLSIYDNSYEQVTTKTALSGRVGQLEFTVPADKVNYTDLKDSFYIIKGRYVKADGSAVEDKPKIGPVNYLVTSMLKSISMSINDTRVTPSDANAAYVHYLHAFTQSKGAKESYLTAGLYYEDTMVNTKTVNQSDPQKTDAAAATTTVVNQGLRERTQFFSDSQEVIMMGKFYIPPHNTNRLYLPHLKFDYSLELAPQEFYSMSTEAAGTYLFEITDAKLLIRRVTCSPAVQLAHEKLLQEKNAVYPVKYMQTKTQSIPANSFSYYWENVFVGNEMPTAILIAFVKGTAYRGALTENPFFFQNVDLSEATVYLGSKKIPNIEIKNNIGRHQSLLSFWETLMSMDLFSTNIGPGGIDRKSFENGAFLLGFDLSRDANPNALYSNSNFNAGNLALQFTFNAGLPHGYTGKILIYCFFNAVKLQYYISLLYFLVIVFGLMHGEIEVNANYQAITSY
jgi:hypothetical protein